MIENNFQRLLLLNQYKILRDLAIVRKDERDEELYEERIRTITDGYCGEYNDFFSELKEEFPKEESELVWDIFEIYSHIKFSYSQLENPTLEEEETIFPGFDGNGEADYMVFCNYITNIKHCYCELADGRTDFNSHSKQCERYRKMRDKWNKMGKPYNMTEEQLKELLFV